ncbi:MAG: hypothetical protein ABW114_12885 [Gaiellaceae bacterium]
MNIVLRFVNWLQPRAFRILGELVRVVTALWARILRRGRFRAWRRGA